MSRTKQTRETARAFVNPLFAWSNAILKSGEMMLDSLATATKNAQAIRVAVLPDADDAPRARPRRKTKSRGASKAKSARRRRR